MGAKLSKKKKGYDVSDPKEKKDEEAISVTAAAKSEAQPSQQAASSGVAEDQAKTEAAVAISAEPAGEVAAVSQEVTSSEAPGTGAVKEEANMAQVETEAVTESASQGHPQEPKADEPSAPLEAKPEVSLPAKEDPALKKAEETLVNLEPQTVPEAECQKMQEAKSVGTAAAPIIECLPATSSTGPTTKNVATCPIASPPESAITVQPAKAADEPVSVVQESTKKSETAVQPEQATPKSDCIAKSVIIQSKEGTTENVAVAVQECTSKPETVAYPEIKTLEVAATQESTSKPMNVGHPEETTIETPEVATKQEPTDKSDSVDNPEESTIETPEVPAMQESTSKPDSVVFPEESTVETPDVVTTKEQTSEPQSVVHPEENTMETPEVAKTKEQTSEPQSVVHPEENTMETPEVATTQEQTCEAQSVVHPEESTMETPEMATTQESTNEPETAIQSEKSVINTVDAVSVQESCAQPETPDKPKDAVVDTVTVAAAQEPIAEVSETSEPVTDSIQEHEVETETLGPTNTEIPPQVLEKSPETTITQVNMVNGTETQAEPEVRVEPIECSTVLEEHTKTTPSLQGEVPKIALSLAEAEAAVIEAIPKIVISESHSTNEFPRDESKECAAEVEPAAELKKVEDTIPEGASETSNRELAASSPASVEAHVSLNSSAANDDVTPANSSQDDKADLENGESQIAASTDMKERLPSPELSGEPQMPEVLLEKSAKSQKEERVNGINVLDVSPEEQQVINDCELKKDLTGDPELPETMSDMAEANNASLNQDVDLL